MSETFMIVHLFEACDPGCKTSLDRFHLDDVFLEVGGPERGAVLQPTAYQAVEECHEKLFVTRLEGAEYPTRELRGFSHFVLDVTSPV